MQIRKNYADGFIWITPPQLQAEEEKEGHVTAPLA